MATKDYLLEIGTEEIPARFVANFLDQLRVSIQSSLEASRLSFSSIQTFATYRRLTVHVQNLETKQADSVQQINGPPISIALNDKGVFLPPALGFAKKVGVDPKELTEKELKGKRILVATQHLKGEKTSMLLQTLIPKAILSVNLPIAMRWGDFSIPFIRPVHWVLSLFGTTVVPFDLFGVKADRYSYGHRFLTTHPTQRIRGVKLTLSSPDEYESILKKQGKVLVSAQKRRASIESFLVKTLLQQHVDQDLLDEVTYLTENPTVIVGTFDEDFLSLPEPVLVECMRKHQKYFSVYKKTTLLNQFVAVADNVTAKNKVNIQKGYETVLVARLKDAQFFWEEDNKQTLSDLVPKLKGVMFQKGMGSIFEKKERLKILTTYLHCSLAVKVDLKDCLQVAEFCKADLVSHMVYEFPSLQGVMGRLYAQKEECKQAVCLGIEDHYKPVGSGAELPQSMTGVLVGLADRLDTVVACFQNNLIPTGSQDPLGVRRALYGMLAVVFEYRLSLSFSEVFDQTYEVLGAKQKQNQESLRSFFSQRLKTFLIDQGLDYDVVDAVLHLGLVNLRLAYDVAQCIQRYRQKDLDSFKLMVDTAVRVKRLAVKADGQQVDQRVFCEPVEKEAFVSFRMIETEIKKVAQADVLPQLSHLSGPLTRYFDQVLVMDKDKKVQKNRLSFLKGVDSCYMAVADFEKIVV